MAEIRISILVFLHPFFKETVHEYDSCKRIGVEVYTSCADMHGKKTIEYIWWSFSIFHGVGGETVDALDCGSSIPLNLRVQIPHASLFVL